MTDISFPQTGDLPDFAHFATLRGTGTSGIINGLEFTADFSVPELTVAEGKALINRPQTQTSHPKISPPQTVTDAAIVVEMDQKTVSLTDSELNHIFIQANVTTDDAPQPKATITNSKPSPASIKIGEIDARTANSVSEGWNRLTESGLTFPDERAAGSEAAQLRLRPGTVVLNRALDIQLFVPADAPDSVQSVAAPTGEVIALDFIQQN
jgi:hypothetical protein